MITVLALLTRVIHASARPARRRDMITQTEATGFTTTKAHT